MRVKVRHVATGPGPSETVVAVNSTTGQVELIVDSRSLKDDLLEVGAVADHNGSFLVEFPRETLSGQWRVWVARKEVEESP